MFRFFNWKNVAITFLLILSDWVACPAFSQLDQQTVRFVEDVLFGVEFSNEPVRTSKLWAQPPLLSTFGNGSHHPKVVSNIVRQINDCLPANRHVRILEPNDESATLKVYFIPLNQFSEIAEANKFEYVDGNWGFFHSKWNSAYEIQSAIVMIATDKVSGTRLNHLALEEITQSLGFPGDSKRFPKSVFFEDASRRQFGKATVLSALDRKLIRYHYRYNQSGSTPVELGINLARNWEDVPIR